MLVGFEYKHNGNNASILFQQCKIIYPQYILCCSERALHWPRELVITSDELELRSCNSSSPL